MAPQRCHRGVSSDDESGKQLNTWMPLGCMPSVNIIRCIESGFNLCPLLVYQGYLFVEKLIPMTPNYQIADSNCHFFI